MNKHILGTAFLVAATAGTASALPRDRIQQTIRGVALLTSVTENEKGEIVELSTGSGTILTAGGAILTNDHNLIDDKGALRTAIMVSLTMTSTGNPQPVCIARPAQALRLPKRDLALLRCEEDLEGKAFTPANWPTVPTRFTGHLLHGDELTVFGYPVAGNGKKDLLPTITVTAGRTAGFVNGEDGARIWIKTDASISGGNSGGTAVDDEGFLVAIPTWVDTDTRGEAGTLGTVGYLRPTEVAELLIEEAYHGWFPGKLVLLPPEDLS
jgi:S1-C subfamily serine protease